MTIEPAPAPALPPAAAPSAGRRAWKPVVLSIAVLLLGYFLVAYLVMPLVWIGYADRHPALEDIPNITYTGDKHPGDPLNVALIGSEADLKAIMLAAKWYPADQLGLRSDVKIAADTVLSRPYDEAPVSSLFLWGRKQDLAFEMPVGGNPRERHHVRFWRSEKLDAQGRPLWIGSATYDKRVGLSDTTGEITHHIAADIDAERDHLFDNLQSTGDLVDVHFIDDFHKVRQGHNGGGDPWHTDGRLRIGTIQMLSGR